MNNKPDMNLYKKNNFFEKGDYSEEFKDLDLSIIRMYWRTL